MSDSSEDWEHHWARESWPWSIQPTARAASEPPSRSSTPATPRASADFAQPLSSTGVQRPSRPLSHDLQRPPLGAQPRPQEKFRKVSAVSTPYKLSFSPQLSLDLMLGARPVHHNRNAVRADARVWGKRMLRESGLCSPQGISWSGKVSHKSAPERQALRVTLHKSMYCSSANLNGEKSTFRPNDVASRNCTFSFGHCDVQRWDGHFVEEWAEEGFRSSQHARYMMGQPVLRWIPLCYTLVASTCIFWQVRFNTVLKGEAAACPDESLGG